MGLSAWWERRRGTLTLGALLTILAGKGLALLGVGALLAEWLRPWAWGLIVVGVALDLVTKWRWLRR